jgi:hypothetical protein
MPAPGWQVLQLEGMMLDEVLAHPGGLVFSTPACADMSHDMHGSLPCAHLQVQVFCQVVPAGRRGMPTSQACTASSHAGHDAWQSGP